MCTVLDYLGLVTALAFCCPIVGLIASIALFMLVALDKASD